MQVRRTSAKELDRKDLAMAGTCTSLSNISGSFPDDVADVNGPLPLRMGILAWSAGT